MVRKVYAYPGIASGDILIKVGTKAHIRVTFANGYLDKKMERPATYSTGDPVMQQVIENSSLFGRRIFLQSSYGTPEPEVATDTTDNAAADEEQVAGVQESSVNVTEYPEVTTFEEALKILKSIPGVKASQLRSMASAKRVASAYGVAFPNYTFE